MQYEKMSLRDIFLQEGIRSVHNRVATEVVTESRNAIFRGIGKWKTTITVNPTDLIRLSIFCGSIQGFSALSLSSNKKQFKV